MLERPQARRLEYLGSNFKSQLLGSCLGWLYSAARLIFCVKSLFEV
jgi:hypothetical protein